MNKKTKTEGLPKMIYKYRPLTTRNDIIRYFDILKKNRLFFPTSTQLNDPFEGMLCPNNFYVAGTGMFLAADEIYPDLEKYKDNTRVLSLSEDCFSPQLWAYYCNDYQGIVLCFYTDKSFKNIKKVQYVDSSYDLGYGDEELSGEVLYNALANSLLFKTSSWKYEFEWRIIEKDNSNMYFNFGKNELAAIIIGHKTDSETVSFIRDTLPSDFPLFKTHPGTLSGNVHILPIDYEIQYDGSKPDFIDTNDELIDVIKNYAGEQ